MSEEQNVETNDGTWSGLKKTIIGAISTAVLAGGTWVTTQLFGGHEETPATPVQQSAPVININNTQQQQQSAGEKTIIIKEVVPAQQATPNKVAEPTKPKKEFTEEEPKW
jgi:hypothetical protein